MSGVYDPNFDLQTPYSAGSGVVGATLAEIAIDGPFERVLTVDFCIPEPVPVGIYTIYFRM
jgi:hypothetical protein